MNFDRRSILDESPGNCAEWKKMIPGDCILYNSTYIPFWNDKILEMDDRLVATGAWGQGGGSREEGGYDYKRATGGILGTVSFLTVTYPTSDKLCRI